MCDFFHYPFYVQKGQDLELQVLSLFIEASVV